MKIKKALAAALLIAAASAHASDQNVCANLAAIGKSAAYANSLGLSEWDALRAWNKSASEGPSGRASDAVFTMGVIEIRAVYRAGDTSEAVGYWTAYNACMGAMK
jgi:hypothetical protein